MTMPPVIAAIYSAIAPAPVLAAKPLPEAARSASFTESFWRRVSPGANGCLEWTGTVQGSGYGVVRIPGAKYYFKAHRVAFMLIVGPIPWGQVLDHLCFNRRCVNVDHLRVTGHYPNLRRLDPRKSRAVGTHCVHGHELTPANTYVLPSGYRRCRTCKRAAQRKWRKGNRPAA